MVLLSSSSFGWCCFLLSPRGMTFLFGSCFLCYSVSRNKMLNHHRKGGGRKQHHPKEGTGRQHHPKGGFPLLSFTFFCFLSSSSFSSPWSGLPHLSLWAPKSNFHNKKGSNFKNVVGLPYKKNVFAGMFFLFDFFIFHFGHCFLFSHCLHVCVVFHCFPFFICSRKVFRGMFFVSIC